MSSRRIASIAAPSAEARSPAFLREIFLLIIAVLAYLIAGLAVQRALLTSQGIEASLQEAAVLVLVTVGQSIVILGRGLDLSVAPIMGFGAAVTGTVANVHHLPIILSALLAIGLGIVFGAVNGVLVVVARIPPIIATLSTLSAYGGLLFIYLLSPALRGTGDNQINSVPDNYYGFANHALVPLLRPPILIALVAVILVHLVLVLTKFGRSVYVVGGNPEAARTEGLRIGWIRFATYIAAGVLASLAGFVWVTYTGFADANTGTGTSIELLSVAAALVGGVTIAGGRGTVLGAAAASVFITVVGTLVVVANVEPIWQAGVAGILLLLAVWADTELRERRIRRRLALQQEAAEHVAPPATGGVRSDA